MIHHNIRFSDIGLKATSFYRLFNELCPFHSVAFVYSPGGGALVFEVGYHPRKKIHVIRVAFQDQAMYARTSFRGAKTCKFGKKVCLTNFGKDMTDKLRKTHAKTGI